MTAARATLFAAVAALGLAPRAVSACGGFYASGVEVSPDQKVIVVHRAGVETYVFRPHFCGAAKDFGVILPIPATLAGSPALADDRLFAELDAVSAPRIEEVCASSGPSCGGGSSAPSAGAAPDAGAAVDVLDRGRVGDFEYVLLQATEVRAFTDWLDQNGFPYDRATASVYELYVARRWYFVAFKVSADVAPPPAGKKLCGDLGPIAVSFATAAPVVPAAIAGVNAGYPRPQWRVFALAAGQQRLGDAATGYATTLHFSGALAADDLASRPALAAAARAGERLTVLDVGFVSPGGEDILLRDDPAPRDYRSVTTVYKPCSGCGSGATPAGSLLLLVSLLVVAPFLKRARRRSPGRAATLPRVPRPGGAASPR